VSTLAVLASSGRLCYTASEKRLYARLSRRFGLSNLGMMRRQTVVDPMSQVLVISATFLLVPVCVLLGFRRPGGALIASGGAALLVSILFWIVLGGNTSLENRSLAGGMLLPVLSISTFILLIAACTLAIHAAVISGRWLWVFFLVVAGCISFAAAYLIGFIPQACFSGATPMPSILSTLLCNEPNSLRPLVFDLAHVLGPLVVLIYGLVAIRAGADATRSVAAPPAAASPGGRRVPPLGLYISPLTSAAAEADTEPNLH
jgi:hypothetical protein